MRLQDIDNLYREMAKNIFTEQVLYKTKPIHNSIEIISKLAQHLEIYIITARTDKMIVDVIRWLKTYDIENKIKDVISSSNDIKQNICKKKKIDFLCDDDLRHLIDSKIKIRVLFNPKGIKTNYKGIEVAKS